MKNRSILSIASEKVRRNYFSALVNAGMIAGAWLLYEYLKSSDLLFIWRIQTVSNIVINLSPIGYLVIVVGFYVRKGNLWSYLDLYDGGRITPNHLLDGFRTQPVKLLFYGLRKFFNIMLWTMLLVIPGVIKSYSYAMADFLFRDYPDEENQDLLAMSESMMDGRKLELFLLDVLFFLISFVLALVLNGIMDFFFPSANVEAIRPQTLELHFPFFGFKDIATPTFAIIFLLVEPFRWATYAVFYKQLLAENDMQVENS